MKPRPDRSIVVVGLKSPWLAGLCVSSFVGFVVFDPKLFEIFGHVFVCGHFLVLPCARFSTCTGYEGQTGAAADKVAEIGVQLLGPSVKLLRSCDQSTRFASIIAFRVADRRDGRLFAFNRINFATLC